MSSKNGNGKNPEPATLSFSLPDVWEVQHWDTYSDGKTVYQEGRTDAGKKTFNILIGQFYGAMALLDAGFIQVEAPDAVLSMLQTANREKMPLWLAKEIGKQVGGAIEAAVNGPLEDSLKQLFATTPTLSATPNP